MSKTEFTLPSNDGKHRLHCVLWMPEGEIKAVLQVVHGMAEHIGRYGEFARFMNEKGVAVVGHDHLGHGQSVDAPEELGFFAPERGDETVIRDIRAVNRRAVKLFPNVPVFMLGNSMGSWFTRRYITQYGGLSGAMLIAGGEVPLAAAEFGRFTAAMACRLKGPRSSGDVLFALVQGNYPALFLPPRESNDILSRNEENVAEFDADPLCGFPFTVSAYRDFFTILAKLAAEKDFDRIDRALPILLASGAEDPVGGRGRDIPKTAARFRELGFADVTDVLYPEDRHEILHETDRAQVFEDIFRWMAARASL